MRSALYLAIQRAANRLLWQHIRAGFLPKPSGPCADCGATPKRVCYDHRDYSEALTVDVVCWSCNQKRGPAVAPLVVLA